MKPSHELIVREGFMSLMQAVKDNYWKESSMKVRTVTMTPVFEVESWC